MNLCSHIRVHRQNCLFFNFVSRNYYIKQFTKLASFICSMPSYVTWHGHCPTCVGTRTLLQTSRWSGSSCQLSTVCCIIPTRMYCQTHAGHCLTSLTELMTKYRKSSIVVGIRKKFVQGSLENMFHSMVYFAEGISYYYFLQDKIKLRAKFNLE